MFLNSSFKDYIVQLTLAEHRFDLHLCTYTWIFKKKHLHRLIQVERLDVENQQTVCIVCTILYRRLENLQTLVLWESWNQFPYLGTI